MNRDSDRDRGRVIVDYARGTVELMTDEEYAAEFARQVAALPTVTIDDADG